MLTKKTDLYEILIRCHDGGPKGAHVQYRNWIEDTETGEKHGESITPAIPVSLADEADKLTIAQVMGEAVHGMALAQDEAKAEGEQHRKNWAAAVAEKEQLQAELEKLHQQLGEAQGYKARAAKG